MKEEVDEARSRIRARISIRPAENERMGAREKGGERERGNENKKDRVWSLEHASHERKRKIRTLVVSCLLGFVLYVIIINKADLPVFPDQSFTSTPQRYQRFVPD